MKSAITAIAAAALLASCRAPAPRALDRASLRPVSLPDLSRVAEPVRAQLREGDARLRRAAADSTTSSSDLAAAYGEMGKLLMAAEYREEAEASLIDAEALNPGDFKWPYYLAHLYRARGGATESAAAFERAVRLQPRDVPALVWLGDACLDQGRADAAQSLFERALAEQPQNVAALYGLGRAALAQSDFTRAVQRFEHALTLAPRSGVIHYQLAMAYRGLGRAEQAEAHLRLRGPGEIRPSDPLMLELETMLESAVAYEVRGAKALDDGDWKAAAAYFRKGIDLAPNEASLHHKLGTALFLSGDASGAAAEFQQALRLSPRFAKAHYSLGVLLAGSGRSAEALAHLSDAVRDDPAYAEARLRLADVLRQSGHVSQALQRYEEAAALDPRITDAPLGYSLALVDLHRYREARDHLAEQRARYPGEPAFTHALIRLLAAAPDPGIRDGRAALTLMRGVLAGEPRSVGVDEMMAMTQAELGQFGEAVTWQRDAMAAAERLGAPERVRYLTAVLRRYEQREPCRTPWSDEDDLGR
jgi:tetratricopeptide (TPR) repeat protein